MSRKYLVLFDGKHESHVTRDGSLEGALIRLLRKLLGGDCLFEGQPLGTFPLEGKRTGLKDLDTFGQKAVKAAVVAKLRGLAGAVVVIDADRNSGPDRVRAFNNAQQRADDLALPAAFGVAIREFDAWMLADLKALRAVLGAKVEVSGDPEGHEDPKAVFRELIPDEVQRSVSDLYAEVIEKADLAVVCKRCPDGFEPFHKRAVALGNRAANADGGG